jgi:hypothetical protein
LVVCAAVQIIFLTTLMIGLFASVILMIGNRCQTADKVDLSDINLRRLADLPGNEGKFKVFFPSFAALARGSPRDMWFAVTWQTQPLAPTHSLRPGSSR